MAGLSLVPEQFTSAEWDRLIGRWIWQEKILVLIGFGIVPEPTSTSRDLDDLLRNLHEQLTRTTNPSWSSHPYVPDPRTMPEDRWIQALGDWTADQRSVLLMIYGWELDRGSSEDQMEFLLRLVHRRICRERRMKRAKRKRTPRPLIRKRRFTKKQYQSNDEYAQLAMNPYGSGVVLAQGSTISRGLLDVPPLASPTRPVDPDDLDAMVFSIDC